MDFNTEVLKYKDDFLKDLYRMKVFVMNQRKLKMLLLEKTVVTYWMPC